MGAIPKELVDVIASRGRNGDDTLLHISNRELLGLMKTGKVTFNPDTGLAEAFSLDPSETSIPGDTAIPGTDPPTVTTVDVTGGQTPPTSQPQPDVMMPQTPTTPPASTVTPPTTDTGASGTGVGGVDFCSLQAVRVAMRVSTTKVTRLNFTNVPSFDCDVS